MCAVRKDTLFEDRLFISCSIVCVHRPVLVAQGRPTASRPYRIVDGNKQKIYDPEKYVSVCYKNESSLLNAVEVTSANNRR